MTPVLEPGTQVGQRPMCRLISILVIAPVGQIRVDQELHSAAMTTG